jgi:hypothetical protein
MALLKESDQIANLSLPNVHFSFEVTRQRKLGKMKIVEVHFIVTSIKN